MAKRGDRHVNYPVLRDKGDDHRTEAHRGRAEEGRGGQNPPVPSMPPGTGELLTLVRELWISFTPWLFSGLLLCARQRSPHLGYSS